MNTETKLTRSAFKAQVALMRKSGHDDLALDLWVKEGGNLNIGWDEFQDIDPLGERQLMESFQKGGDDE